MRHVRKAGAFGCWLTLAAFLVALIPVTALAEDGPREMTLKRGFLRSLKYQIGEEKPEPVYGFSGLSFKPGFEEVMSAHPAALKEARGAFTGTTLSLLGSLTMLSGAVWMLVDTLGDVDELNDGRIPEDDTNWTPVIIIAVGGSVMVIGGMIANKRLTKGVKIFNREEAAAYGSLDPSAASVLMARRQVQVEPLSAAPRLALGIRSTNDARLPDIGPSREATVSLQFSF